MMFNLGLKRGIQKVEVTQNVVPGANMVGNEGCKEGSVDKLPD